MAADLLMLGERQRGWAFDDQHVAVASIRHEGEGDALWDQHIVAGLVD